MKKLIIFTILLQALLWAPSGIYHYFYEKNSEEEEVTTTPKIRVVTRREIYDIVVTLRGTTYQPLESQCDSDPLVTSNMTRVNLEELKKGSQKLCAISYDIKKRYGFKFGDEFDLFTKEGEFLGRYLFCDHMNPRIKETCDIMIHPDDKPTSYEGMTIKRVKKES